MQSAQIKHDHLSWTVCYENSCLIYFSEKKESGWFPQRYKRHSTSKISFGMAGKASIKEKKPPNYNDEYNNPAHKSMEL